MPGMSDSNPVIIESSHAVSGADIGRRLLLVLRFSIAVAIILTIGSKQPGAMAMIGLMVGAFWLSVDSKHKSESSTPGMADILTWVISMMLGVLLWLVASEAYSQASQGGWPGLLAQANTWLQAIQSLQDTEVWVKVFHRAPWFIVASLVGAVGQIVVSRMLSEGSIARNPKEDVATGVINLAESMSDFDNPLEPTPSEPDVANQSELEQVCAVATACYEQFELPESGSMTMYFEQSEEYVDSFIEVSTRDSVVQDISIAFTFPATATTEWQGYAITIDQQETMPRMTALEEIAVDGSTTRLETQELSWLAAHFVLVCQQPLAPGGERPGQAAPSTMY